MDERVFGQLTQIKQHGGKQWWLYLSTCQLCAQDWMVAQDERIYDNYYLMRLSPAVARDIVELDVWPSDFITYEQVLRLGRATGQHWTFVDPQSPALVYTAQDLRRERPEITDQEIADLLAISLADAAKLSD